MSNILAEVEGICLHERVEHMADFLPGPYYWCEDCKKELSEFDYHSRQREFPDYPNDLEACMRVAKALTLEVHFGIKCIWLYSRLGLKDYQSSEWVATSNYISDNLAATLYPMLVEIAEERKKNGNG